MAVAKKKKKNPVSGTKGKTGIGSKKGERKLKKKMKSKGKKHHTSEY